MKGKLITFEGIECSGKGTQIKLVEAWLRQMTVHYFSDHEPGGTLYGEALRAILKNPELALPAIYGALEGHSDYSAIKNFHLADTTDYSRSGQLEIFLFMASRVAFAEKIKPLIASGLIVLADRLMDSSTAYQGYGRLQGDQKMLATIEANNRLALSGLWPDLTFVIDIPVEVMFERMAKESAEKNSFFEEKYNREFYQRVREGYLQIAKNEPDRVKIIDGTQPIQQVFEQIKPFIADQLI